jgi:hypothetical protein
MAFDTNREADPVRQPLYRSEEPVYEPQYARYSDHNRPARRGTAYSGLGDLEQVEAKRKPAPTATRSASIFWDSSYLFFVALLSTALFGFALWYVQAAFSAETAIRTRQILYRVFKIDVGSTLAVLRITQGVLSTCSTIALMRALEMLQWGLAGRDHGLEGSAFLSLSPSTHIFGVLRIVLSRISKWTARAWGLVR